MKKVILLLVLAFVICGCSSEQTKELKDSQSSYKTVNPKIVIIDSCEYIVCYSIGGTHSMTWTEPIYIHKGNCKYCAERRRKEQEELIRKIQSNE